MVQESTIKHNKSSQKLDHSRYFTNSFVRRDQEQYAKKLKMPTGSRAKLKRAYLDVNFFNLPEIRSLSRKFGKISTMCLIEIYLAMSVAEDACIDEDAILAIVEGYEMDNQGDFIPYCLDKSLIKLFREISPDIPVENPIISKSNPRLPDSDNDYDINNKLGIALTEFQEPKIQKAIERWKSHRHALGKPFGQMALDSLINLYRGRANELPDDIDYSISNGWKTLNAKSRDSKLVFQKPQQEVARPVIDNYKEPTAEEKRKPTEEEKKRVRDLINKSLGGRKVA